MRKNISVISRVKILLLSTICTTVSALLPSTLTAQDIPANGNWIKSDVDWSQYHSFYIMPLGMEDIKVLKPSWATDDQDEWKLNEGAEARIQQLFDEYFNAALTAGGDFTVVDEPGPGTIRLEIEILSVTPYVKPGTNKDSEGNLLTSLGSGEMMISSEYRDSETRELLALIESERPIGEEYREVSAANTILNIQEAFTIWGNRIRRYVDNVQNN